MKPVAFLVATALAATPAFAFDHHGKDWNFGDGTTPEEWSKVNPDYAMCDAGDMQSPIDLGSSKVIGNITVMTNYGATGGKLVVGEEKVQVDFAPGQFMHSGTQHFNLLQVHFHTPAEHAFDGERHPLVAHFVHATDDGALGVIGVMFVEGDANPELDKIIAAMTTGAGTDVMLDTSAMIPADLTVYRYMGSLTTPPCSEGVNWHVASNTMTASAEQIEALYEALGPSARSVQPLGNRLLVAPAE
ncbi:carbonic anhydrase [Parerythrobacter aestuarii]|uniref:carbonic anhydrase n=1 Tax=Parerythrobacter aestuarii TaxID=3020909 RepID=UPI0024DE0596|nr:carbonic anhydrase family protein [Parerythrobacter aestuarii]